MRAVTDVDAPLVSADLAELERRKRAKSIPVPTDDGRVKLKLRELGHPICLFGEDAHDRRERLRELLSRLSPDEVQRVLASGEDGRAEQESEIEEEFFTEGSQELKAARLDMLRFSLERARDRLAREREMQTSRVAQILARKDTAARLGTLTNDASQIGDDRPLTYCTFGDSSRVLAVGSMGGSVKLWSATDYSLLHSWAGHKDRVGGIAFHPSAYRSLSPSSANLVSGASDGTVRLWSLDSTSALGELVGHTNRVSRVAFHPSGRYVGTASYDTSWRLWDVATCRELVLQEGHSREVYDVAFHCDGALAASASLDAHGRVWDLRTGRSIMVLDGHVRAVTAVAFSPNGVQLATGAQDNAINVWDLRMRKQTATIPAHTAVVSHLRFEPKNGDYLVSVSFDRTARVWMFPEWRPIRTLAGHEKQIAAVDVKDDASGIVTASFDHTFKLWHPEESATASTSGGGSGGNMMVA